MGVRLLHGDCLDLLKTLPDQSVDSVVTDPPYGLSDHAPEDVAACLRAWLRGEEYRPDKKGFMGRSWDAWVPGPEVWKECLRVLKPGGHLLAFAGTRSMDLMSMSVRLAGFELRDSIGFAKDGVDAPLMAWVYGCLDQQSEVLSRQHGWIMGINLREGDEVRQWDPATGEFSWVVPSRITRQDYVGNMVRIGGPLTDQMLTPNHRVYHRPKNSSWPESGSPYEVVEAGRLFGNGWVGMPIINDGNGERVAVAWTTDEDRWSEHYEGKVWCVTVPTGAFMARRNGKIFVTGNSGFPKSMDVAKAIDKAARGVPQGASDPTSPNHGKYKGGCSETNPSGRGFGAGPGSFMAEAGAKDDDRPLVPEAEAWKGWGTALKPAWEPIILARRPLEGTVAENVLAHGVGGLNIDESRVEYLSEDDKASATPQGRCTAKVGALAGKVEHDGDRTEFERPELKGRFPANVIHDGSDDVLAIFDSFGEKSSGKPGKRRKPHETGSMSGTLGILDREEVGYADSGSVSRFFYCAKAGKGDRAGSQHPTVKPVALMKYLVKLATPSGGVVLDPFAGSGTTGEAAVSQGFDAILIEREPEYAADIRARFVMFLED